MCFVFSVQILTKDSVTVNVDAIVQFRIRDPVASIKFVVNAANATRLLAQTTLRNTLGGHTLSEILSSKDTIQNQMCVSGGKLSKDFADLVSNLYTSAIFLGFRMIWMMRLIGGASMFRKWKCMSCMQRYTFQSSVSSVFPSLCLQQGCPSASRDAASHGCRG